ncbi:MAG: ABC transporter substrate-binding protein [Oscillospiraceae bacterium]|nr:ABC transporter substrate-binding protein [Oscillospiraceae bacterium]
MKKRILAILLALAMAFSVFALTACNGDEVIPPDDQIEDTTTPPPDTNDDNGDTEDPPPPPPEIEVGAMTEVGTLRSETLIVEYQFRPGNPGRFNPHMAGTSRGTGVHQFMWSHLYEINTSRGEQFPEIAADFPTSNEDFTVHTLPIREGMYWSDGMPITAHDVAYTFNLILTNEEHVHHASYNALLESVEATSDFEVTLVTNDPFPRIAQRFGVVLWGREMVIAPKHIFEAMENPVMDEFSDPVTSTAWVVHSFDPDGAWIRLDLREDWERSTTAVVMREVYGITDPPAARHIWMRSIGDDTARQMALINNEVDAMVEFTPEMMRFVTERNPNIEGWYGPYFPWGTSDDPCSKGLTFNAGVAPFDNPLMRWGLVLAIDFDEASMAVFEGIGRSSPLPFLTITGAAQEIYLRPMLPWLEALTVDPGDGGPPIPVWDGGYADRMAEIQRARGIDIPNDRATLDGMFGLGTWRYDPEGAMRLFEAAGLELRGDDWFFEGEPFVINMIAMADAEVQAGRTVLAAADQFRKFGFNVNVEEQISATWIDNNELGHFDITGSWPTMFVTQDIAADLQAGGWWVYEYPPIGESHHPGNMMRFGTPEIAAIVLEKQTIPPEDPRTFELAMEFLKLVTEEMPWVGFHGGIKFCPINTTYWTNWPSAENNYDGPWWWWSCFKYIAWQLQPTT